MKIANQSLGNWGEIDAIEFLRKKGYQIVAKNFRTKIGEIDIIGKKDDLLVFVEVKARVGDLKGKPWESISFFKLKHLKKAIYFYLMEKKLANVKLRVDVISIEFNSDYSVKNLKHFENVDLP